MNECDLPFRILLIVPSTVEWRLSPPPSRRRRKERNGKRNWRYTQQHEMPVFPRCFQDKINNLNYYCGSNNLAPLFCVLFFFGVRVEDIYLSVGEFRYMSQKLLICAFLKLALQHFILMWMMLPWLINVICLVTTLNHLSPLKLIDQFQPNNNKNFLMWFLIRKNKSLWYCTLILN